MTAEDERARRRRRTWITRGVVAVIVALVVGAWAMVVNDGVTVLAEGR